MALDVAALEVRRLRGALAGLGGYRAAVEALYADAGAYLVACGLMSAAALKP